MTLIDPFFDHEPLQAGSYDDYLKAYIGKYLDVAEGQYEVISEEMGNIPMTDYPFFKDGSEKITKIGTAGSWVKGSTGYSFKNAIHNSRLITENLRSGRRPNKGIISQRHRYYDNVLLTVLDLYNDRGPEIFHQMFKRNPISRILKFLGEDSSFLDEVLVMISLTRIEFTSAAINRLVGR